MKKLIYVFAALLFLASYNSPTPKNTLYYWKIKGEVKTLVRHNYKFTVVDGKAVKGEPSGTINGHYSVAFNKSGNYTEYVNYSLDGKISVKEKFKRNDKGYLTEWTMDWPVDSLDAKGEIKYDEVGNRIEVVDYNPDGTIKSKTKNKFDSSGNAINRTRYNSDGTIKWRGESTFDKNRNWLSSNYYNAEGELTRKQWGTNNKQGNWVVANTHIIEGDKKIKYSATYQYDEEGNWIKFIIYKDGDPSVMNIREFTYY